MRVDSLTLIQSLWLSRSWTTRERRPSERGDEYFYVDRSTFEKAIESQQFLEWAEFHGHLYGTPLPDAPEGADMLLEIEVQGAEQVLKTNPNAVVLLDPSALHGTTRRAPTRSR